MRQDMARRLPWAFSRGRVGYAIGDVHGRADLLASMLAQIAADAEATQARDPVIVLLGDYIDRGPDARGVLDLLCEGHPWGFERRLLRGNHEAALAYFLDAPEAGRAWLQHGGLATFASYGLRPPSLGASGNVLHAAAEALRVAMGSEHLRLLAALEPFALYGDYMFVHAGVDTRHSLAEQDERDLYWIRARFLEDEREFSHCVVHGHTPSEAPFRDRRRIGLDTGAYQSGLLTGARFEQEHVRFLSVGPKVAAPALGQVW